MITGTNAWLVWLGLASVIAVIASLIIKPMKSRSPQGYMDTPIHTKPLFKVASILVLSLIFSFLVIATI